MTRKALVLAVLAMLVALVGGTGRAQAAGGTYRITAGGDQDWAPGSGAIDQTASDALITAGTMTGDNQGHSVGNVDYEIASGPGVVRAKVDGSFTIPSNLAYPFNPSLQAVSTTELTISAPDDVFVNTSVNLHVDGIIDAPVCGDRPTCGAEDVYVSIGPFVRQAEFNTLGETRSNALGLTLDPVTGGYRVHGDVTSSTLGIRTNTPYPVTIVLNLSGRYAGGPAPTAIGGNFDDPASLYQVSFAPTGPVLNDIPAGYTVSGPNVVNNRWSDPFASSGPADTTPPKVAGTPDRQPNFFGWYNAPVVIDWQATDNSGQATDPADTVASTDGKDVVYTSGQSCDGSGNCATGSLALSIDTVAPVVTCPQPAPVFELNRPSGTIEPTVTETLSGIVSGSIGVPDVSSVGQKSITFDFSDKAGNSTTATCGYSVVDPAADTTPPVVTVPGDIAVDATSPTGANVTYSASAHDDTDPSPSLACAPASGSTFPIGSTTVTCTAKDAAGNTADASFHVQVRSAGEQVARLIDKTNAVFDLPALRPVLRAPLQAAAAALAANRPAVACVALNGYLVIVRLAPGSALTPAERAGLIADANRIKAVIGCR